MSNAPDPLPPNHPEHDYPFDPEMIERYLREDVSNLPRTRRDNHSRENGYVMLAREILAITADDITRGITDGIICAKTLKERRLRRKDDRKYLSREELEKAGFRINPLTTSGCNRRRDALEALQFLKHPFVADVLGHISACQRADYDVSALLRNAIRRAKPLPTATPPEEPPPPPPKPAMPKDITYCTSTECPVREKCARSILYLSASGRYSLSNFYRLEKLPCPYFMSHDSDSNRPRAGNVRVR